MFKYITVPVIWALALVGAVSGPLWGADAGDEDFRVITMGVDPGQKGDAGDWDAIFKANNYNKLKGNEKQIRKARLAENFDSDMLDRKLQLNWYGAADDCAAKGRLPDYAELLKIWDTECKESTSAVCSAVYWTSDKMGERALGVNFLNGYVVAKDLDSFAYVRCIEVKQARKPAGQSAKAKARKKKGGDSSAKIIDFVRNYQPLTDGPRLEEKLTVMITGAGGSAGAANWAVKKKRGGFYSAMAVVPVSEGEIKFTFNVNPVKKTVTPVDARAKALFKAITDPDIADGDMY